MNPLEVLAASPLWRQPPLAIAATLVAGIASGVVLAAVAIDFAAYHRQERGVVGSDRSLVETGTMAAFFVAYYLVIRFRWLEVDVGGVARVAMVIAGTALVVLGTVFNVWGRVMLKSSWANQITIYEGQRLITTGPYAVVRHPLYASLVWMFVGGSLMYSNPLSLAITLAVFVPMMYVRAKKEDALLEEVFGKEYEGYRGRTGMLVPKVRRPTWTT